MPIPWTSEAEAQLLLGVLKQFQGRINYHALAEHMGPGCTVAAVKQHILKLRRESSGSAMNSPRSKSAANTPTGTPKKPKRPRSPQTPIQKAKGVDVASDYGDTEESEKDKKDIRIIKDEEDPQKLKISFVDLDD